MGIKVYIGLILGEKFSLNVINTSVKDHLGFED